MSALHIDIRKIRSWLCTWEIYLIVLIAGFLRFYQIDTAEFDADQAMVFRMAHDAIHHGLLPATSNIASIRIVNPPAVIYLLMLVAALTADPLWGTMLVAVFNVAAVLVTYLFVRRYYGRLAGIIAALLYATAAKAVYFSRFIWQQNLIAPFVVLFMFALYWGVVERRKGWLFPALLLLGILIQLHETTTVLVVPLLAALILAPRTVRWRDLALGLFSLLLIYSTYLLWEISAKLRDLNIILTVSKLHAHFDDLVITYYKLFLTPYDQPPTNTHTLIYMLVPLLVWLHRFTWPLAVFGFITAFVGIFWPRHVGADKSAVGAINRPLHDVDNQSRPALWARPLIWWRDFRASPERCGFVLLLVWQIVPLLVLSRHAVPVYAYYLLMLMPGPFLLIGIFIAKMNRGFQKPGRLWNVPGYILVAVACFVIVTQFIGSTAVITDEANGNNPHGFSYNTLGSLQHALTEADQLAQQRHINHVYITTNSFTQVALTYLAEQMRTPTTLFDASQCLVLPDPAAGPAVFLVHPFDTLTNALLSQFATTTLIDQPARLGSAPFQLYIVQPLAAPVQTHTIPNPSFVNNLQLLDTHAQYMSFNNAPLLVTHWSFLRNEQPSYRTAYNYAMTALLKGNGNNSQYIQSQCISTAMRAGDQLFVAFGLPKRSSLPASVTVEAKYFTTFPQNLAYGPFLLETIADQRTPSTTLRTTGGGKSITLGNG